MRRQARQVVWKAGQMGQVTQVGQAGQVAEMCVPVTWGGLGSSGTRCDYEVIDFAPLAPLCPTFATCPTCLLHGRVCFRGKVFPHENVRFFAPVWIIIIILPAQLTVLLPTLLILVLSASVTVPLLVAFTLLLLFVPGLSLILSRVQLGKTWHADNLIR